MTTIVCIGACYIDTILTVPHFPEEDAKLRATSLSRRRGGNCPNTLEVLQQFTESRAASIASNDDIGEQHMPRRMHAAAADDSESNSISNTKLFLIATLPARTSVATRFIAESLSGIDLSHCVYREDRDEAASSYILKSAAQDSRTIVNYNDLDEMTLDEFTAAADTIVREQDEHDNGRDIWWHFEGRIPEITLSCINYLRSSFQSSTISVEIEKPGRPGLSDLAQAADVVFYSRSWAQSHGFIAAQPFLTAQTKQLRRTNPRLFCTWGPESAATFHNGTLSTAPAPTVSHVVDPIGAGDTFIAGVLFALTANPKMEVLQALRLGTLIASEKIQREGFQGLREAVSGYIASSCDIGALDGWD